MGARKVQTVKRIFRKAVMKRFGIVFWLVFWTNISLAQEPKRLAASTKSDLSGTWVFDLSQSDIGSPKGSPLYDALTLVILHHDPEFKILRKLKKKNSEKSQLIIYYADKRGEANPSIDGHESIKSKTQWEDGVIVSRSSSFQDVPFGYLSTETMERWELSPDGNTLKQISSFKHTWVINGAVSPAGLQKIFRVFKRVT
jgi:hypothetical protein